MQLYYGGNTLKESINSTRGISKIKIAVAYFSEYGLKTLKDLIKNNNLNKNRVELYLSPEFTNKNQGKILKELIDIAKVNIVFDAKFHPKVYLFECKNKNKLIFGSSNFTQNGIENNIEFDSIMEIENNSLYKTKVDLFFDHCNSKSKLVDEEIIKWYESIESELEELRKVQKKITKRIYANEMKDDPFDEDDYDFTNYYFKYSDYETFFTRNEKKDDISINKCRAEVKEKILEIHKNIYSKVKKLGINCHWRKDHITSLIRPCTYNYGKVDWLGVRYGKTESEIKVLNMGTDKGEGLGFQKHACIQYAISADVFEVNLFHSVPNDAFDRSTIYERLKNDRFRNSIENELSNLKGHGFIWTINEKTFDIDKDDISQFHKFYISNDCEGKFSSLSKVFNPDDEEIKSLDSICDIVYKYIEMLIPLYNLVSYRLK
ncbi:Predicted HKD family nuclease [uncultured Clostridium sp.]|nr:Predicted HKD family nuclease [uncultured Clostridium sp.]